MSAQPGNSRCATAPFASRRAPSTQTPMHGRQTPLRRYADQPPFLRTQLRKPNPPIPAQPTTPAAHPRAVPAHLTRTKYAAPAHRPIRSLTHAASRALLVFLARMKTFQIASAFPGINVCAYLSARRVSPTTPTRRDIVRFPPSTSSASHPSSLPYPLKIMCQPTFSLDQMPSPPALSCRKVRTCSAFPSGHHRCVLHHPHSILCPHSPLYAKKCAFCALFSPPRHSPVSLCSWFGHPPPSDQSVKYSSFGPLGFPVPSIALHSSTAVAFFHRLVDLITRLVAPSLEQLTLRVFGTISTFANGGSQVPG
ncbi:hypothetical protein C8J57DRAFT_1507738 [Mycena rebaudengoi]|jgi:hypothetical protein|nr:hypothetical protein C8J57DRAFT_1507738 [Mycena rebaudengoi]